jgi:hypothetical protein
MFTPAKRDLEMNLAVGPETGTTASHDTSWTCTRYPARHNSQLATPNQWKWMTAASGEGWLEIHHCGKVRIRDINKCKL